MKQKNLQSFSAYVVRESTITTAENQKNVFLCFSGFSIGNLGLLLLDAFEGSSGGSWRSLVAIGVPGQPLAAFGGGLVC